MQSKIYRKSLTEYLIFILFQGPLMSLAILPIFFLISVAIFPNKNQNSTNIQSPKPVKPKTIRELNELPEGPLSTKTILAHSEKKRLERQKQREREREREREKQQQKQQKILKEQQKIKQKENNSTITMKDILQLLEFFFSLILVFLFNGYFFYKIWKQKIYFDEKGVWAKLGYFPWNEGFIFIKWSEIARIGYTQNPFGFLFASSNVHIIRKYSGEPITIKHIFKGKQFSGEASYYFFDEIDND